MKGKAEKARKKAEKEAAKQEAAARKETVRSSKGISKIGTPSKEPNSTALTPYKEKKIF